MSEQSTYSKLVKWEVYNFMSIEHGECEFDERNIINLKGYNDSGKSAMLRALDVLMSNMSPQKQVEFIQDDKDYFRIIAYFDDGVSILRDKYINGQSLYEMYKDGQVIFSTKVGDALARVNEVPEPIRDYLGLIQYENTVLNSRSCFEKQIGVQTTGSENYKMFNTVLKSEEIASASAMLNNDKNKLVADINKLDADIEANKSVILLGANLTKGMIDFLHEHDANVDKCANQETFVTNVQAIVTQLDSISVAPEVGKIDTAQLDALLSMVTLQKSIDNIVDYPAVPNIQSDRLDNLLALKQLVDQIDTCVDYPEIKVIDNTQLDKLLQIDSIIKSMAECDNKVANIDAELVKVTNELDTLMNTLNSLGVKMVKCPNCGKVFDSEENHVD